MIGYSYKDRFCSNIRSTFVDIYLPKSKQILLGILYIPPDKSDFIKQINVLTETEFLDKQECYIPGDFNINLLLDEKQILSTKSSNDQRNKWSELTSNKGLPRFLILIDYHPHRWSLDSSQKVSQCDVIALGILSWSCILCKENIFP